MFWIFLVLDFLHRETRRNTQKKKKRAQQEDGLHPPPYILRIKKTRHLKRKLSVVLSNGETDFTQQSHTQE